MTEENKIYIKQHNYDLVSQHDYWTIEEAINYLVAFELKEKRWQATEPAEKEFAKLFEQILDMVKKSINNYTLCIKRSTYLEDSDPMGPYTATNYHASTVSTPLFVEWAAKRRFKLPTPFKRLLPRYDDYQEQQAVQGGSGIGQCLPSKHESAEVTRVIDAVFHAVIYCFHQEEGAVVEDHRIYSDLVRSGFGDIPQEALNDICTKIPEEIRAMMIPLEATQRRSYGTMKLQMDNVYKAIEASVGATLYIEGLPADEKITDEELYGWLHQKGYGSLTTRMSQKLWQSLPPQHKRPAGATKYVKRSKK